MARAAAKRRQPVRHHDADRRRRKDSSGQRFEDTLFFNRLRKQAKWVFVFLAVVFGVSFALFGVGSSVGGGLSDIFQGIRGSGSGQTSVADALKATQKNPKDAKAWHDLATAYETKAELANAIGAWTTYTTLRPKDAEGWTQLATDYTTRFNNETADAQAAQTDALGGGNTTFGPPSTSPLGRALASVTDPIGQTVANAANQRFNNALQARQETANNRVDAYQHVAKLQPSEPAAQLQLADAATDATNASVAIAAYKRFIELAPDDNQVPYAKQRIKTLQSQLTPSSQG